MLLGKKKPIAESDKSHIKEETCVCVCAHASAFGFYPVLKVGVL